MNTVATSRPAPTLVTPKLTPSELMRQRAIAIGALEQISIQGGTAGLVARNALARIRGEVPR